ncbi:hypothetical protein ACOSOMT5_P2047 [Acidiphilium sp. MT5]
MKILTIINEFLAKFQGGAAGRISALPVPVQDIRLDPRDSTIMMYVSMVFSDHLEPEALRRAVNYCFETYPTIEGAHFSPLINWVNEHADVKFYEIPVRMRVQLWRGVIRYFGSSFAAEAERLPLAVRSIPYQRSWTEDKRRQRAIKILFQCFMEAHFNICPIADAEQIYPFKAVTRKFYIHRRLERFHCVKFGQIAEPDRQEIYRSILDYFDLTEDQFRYPRVLKVIKYTPPANAPRGDSIRR